MSERFYPQIASDQLQPLQIVRRLMKSDPGYLDDSECPFDEDTKEFLRSICGIAAATSGEAPAVFDDLNAEVARLYKELTDFGQKVGKDDNAQQNTYFRLSGSLLEKLIELKERAIGIKFYEQFTNTTLQIMEDELPPDRRTSVIARMKEAGGIED